jgi:hypothetical protein
MQLRIYNVTYLPSLIIDEEHIIEGFKKKGEIEKYLE